MCIAINDKSIDSTAKHLSCDKLLHYKSIIQFAGDWIFKIGEHLADRNCYCCCYVNMQINVSLLSTKNQTAVDQFWLTDWQTDAISDWPTV